MTPKEREAWSLYAKAMDDADYLRALDSKNNPAEKEINYSMRTEWAQRTRLFLCGSGSDGLAPQAQRELEAFVLFLRTGGTKRHGTFEYWRRVTRDGASTTHHDVVPDGTPDTTTPDR